MGHVVWSDDFCLLDQHCRSEFAGSKRILLQVDCPDSKEWITTTGDEIYFQFFYGSSQKTKAFVDPESVGREALGSASGLWDVTQWAFID